MRIAIIVTCLLLAGCDGFARFFGVQGEVTIDELQRRVDAGQCRDVENVDPEKVTLDGAPEGLPYYFVAFCKQISGRDIGTALEYYEIALQRGADPFWIYYNRGQLYLTRGNLPNARADLERAYALRPDHPDIAGVLSQAGGETPNAGAQSDATAPPQPAMP